MREILFRGKRADNGEWVEGYYARESNHACFANELKYHQYISKDVFMDWGLGGLEQYEVIPETIGQYTGLCDKNGKKIFEGDIFRPFDNEIVVVTWIDYYSTLGFLCRIEHTETKRGKEITESHDGWSMLCDYELSNLEIIGNVTDNPELLKGGAE